MDDSKKAIQNIKQALRQLATNGVPVGNMIEAMKEIEEKYAESEDERIRKALIDWFSDKHAADDFRGIAWERIVAWLEEQGEQKHTAEEVLIKAGLKPYKDGDQWCVLLGDNIQEGICGFGNTIEDALYAFLKDLIASQGEQKPANKIEPKFHEGELVVTDKNNVVQIKAIKDSKYVLENTMRFSVDYVDKCWRKWTIKDAKDGDVLVYQGEMFILKDLELFHTLTYYCCYDGKRFITNSLYVLVTGDFDNIKPATKEQRDQLEKAMTDAGYTFDFEKKELKKIEQNPIKVSKREWSEDDSVMIDNILGTYKTLEDMLDLTTSQDRDILVSMNFERDWIKSLKYRIQQKQEWSEEDERIKNNCISYIENYKKELPRSEITGIPEVIEWLKSLRPQNRCGWNDMSVKPIYPCDILYQQPNGNMFIYRYIEGGRANDAQTPTFCNLDENGKWIYLKDVKPQNTWKPSDYELEVLKLAAEKDGACLMGLYEQLKKLK